MRAKPRHAIVADGASARALIESLATPIVVIDRLNGAIVDVNRSASEFYGFTRDELLGMDYVALLGEPERRAPGSSFGATFDRDGPSEEVHRDRSGAAKIVYVEFVNFDRDGRDCALVAVRERLGIGPDGSSGQSTEITALMMVADTIPQFIWTADGAGNVDFNNEQFRRSLWRSPDGGQALLWPDLLHPDDRAECLGLLRDAALSGSEFLFEGRIKCESGDYRRLLLTARPWIGPKNEILQVVGSAIDVDDRRKAEEETRDAVRQVRETLEAMSDAFYTLDEQWRFVSVNSNAEKLLGFDREELIGKVIWDVFPDARGTDVELHFRRAYEHRSAERFEYFYPRWSTWYALHAIPAAGGVAVYLRNITSEHESAAQLTLLQAAISNIVDAVIVTEAEPIGEPGPRIVFVNDSFSRQTGYLPEEVIGKSPRMFQGPKTERSELDRIRTALEKCEAVSAQLTNYTKDARQIAIKIDIVPLMDDQGVCTHYVSTQHDVTQRLRSESAQRLGEERFRAVAQAATDVIWDWDLKADKIWWNEGYQRVFGLDPGDGRDPQAWARRIHPDDREWVVRSLTQAISNRAAEWEATYRFERGDGAICLIEDRGRLIFDADGEPVRFVGGMTDATARDAAQAALSQYAERLSRNVEALRQLTAFAAGPDAQLHEYLVATAARLLAADGASLAWAEGAELSCVAAYGIAENKRGSRAPIAQSWSGLALRTGDTLVCADTAREARADVSACMRAGIRSMISIRLSGRVSGEPGGGVLSVASSSVNFFDKNAVASLELFAQSVEALIERRRIEEKWRQAQRLEAVGRLTGGVAHDFNNLLTVILGNAETLTRELAGSERLEPLAEMTRRAAERGAQLTGRLLAFSRRQTLDAHGTNVARLIKAGEVLIKRAVGESIDVEIEVPEDLWPAFVDAGQLENAILNLSINARDAMRDGGRLTIKLANVEVDAASAELEPGAYVSVDVIDSGAGMSPSVVARAFEPFFSTKEAGQGSGLGLSMVFGFAKQSKGHVEITSQEGVGTTVRLYLPRAMSDEDEATAYEPGELVASVARILYVEDDDLVRGHVLSQLRSLGYKVTEARNAREALAALSHTDEFDLLLTDIIMSGGMNGRDLAEVAVKRAPHLRVLFTSGYAQAGVIHDERLEQGIDFIAKPFRSSDLNFKIQKVLAGPSERRRRHRTET